MNQAKADTFVETQIVEQGQLEPKLVEQSKQKPLVEHSKQEPLVVEPPAKPVDLTTESSDGG